MSQADVNLLRVLKSAIDDDDLPLVERTADQFLGSSPDDKDAAHCKLIALLLQNKHKQALTFLDRHPSLLEDHTFHKAYCLYRSQQDQKCLSALQSIPQSDRGEGERALEGQVRYRQGEVKEFISFLESLQPTDEEDVNEVQTNIVAACIVGSQDDHALEVGARAEDPSYELLFNLGCAATNKGDFEGALSLIERSMKVCQQSLAEDDADEAEVANSTAALRVQRAYILQQMGNTTAAMETYNVVLQEKPSDAAVVAVASNNIVTLRSKDQKLFDSLKKSQKAANCPKFKLLASQREALMFNRCLLLILAKQPEKARNVVSEFSRQMPNSEYPAFVEACLAYMEQKFDQCIQILQKVARDRPNDSVRCQLTLTQIYVLRNDIPSAIATLRSIPDVPYQPAGVATLVALHEKNNDIEGACTLFREAIEYWNSKDDAQSVVNLHTLSMKNAEYMLQHNRLAEAAASYEKLVHEFKDKSSAEYQRIVGELVMVACKVDPELALRFSADLPDMMDLDDVDMDNLETVAFTRAERKGLERKQEAKEGPTKKKNKKKRKRLPKNYPNCPAPDPERWLPRWERKSNKKKNRRKNPVRGGGQGASYTQVSAREKQLDITQAKEKTSAEKAKERVGSDSRNKKKKNKKKRGGGRR